MPKQQEEKCRQNEKILICLLQLPDDEGILSRVVSIDLFQLTYFNNAGEQVTNIHQLHCARGGVDVVFLRPTTLCQRKKFLFRFFFLKKKNIQSIKDVTHFFEIFYPSLPLVTHFTKYAYGVTSPFGKWVTSFMDGPL